MTMQDKIGRKDIVDKICGLVDSLQKDQNFCLSINGAWGSGKSFVLQMIEQQLLKKEEYVIVKYDAWENTFYSDPLISILSCVIDGIDDKLYLVEQYETKIKKAAKTGANTLAKVSSKISKLKDVVEGIKCIIKSFHNPIDTESMADFKSYQSLLRQTKEVLNEITQKGEYREKQTKIIVLVDEIDRCLPDEQLKILERLHHLFDIKNCAVIVALNKDAICKNFEKNYGGDGEDYLRKFFQYTFQLGTNAIVLLKNKLIDLFCDINDMRKEPINKNNTDFIINDISSVMTYIGKNANRTSLYANSIKFTNRDIVNYINTVNSILDKIIDCHPAILWFATRLLAYQMFDSRIFQSIIIENRNNDVFFADLNYLGHTEQPSGFENWRFSHKGNYTELRYAYYSNGYYNDLLFLMNLCRYRDNDEMIKVFCVNAKNYTFNHEINNLLQIINQIKMILKEIDRYGDRK